MDRKTISLVAVLPGSVLPWKVGDVVKVTTETIDTDPIEQRYKIIYVDPQRISLETV